MSVTITIDPTQWNALLDKLRGAPAKVDRAIVRASNRIADMGLARTKRAVSKELGIKQSDLVKPHRFGALKSQSTGTALRVNKTNASGKPAEIKITGRRIPLSYMRPKELKGGFVSSSGKNGKRRQFNRTKGVRYNLGARGTKTARNAFMGRTQRGDSGSASLGASGHIGVFIRSKRAASQGGTSPAINFGKLGKRNKKGRLPLRALLGPSVPGAADRNPEFKRLVTFDLGNEMLKRMTHEVGRILAKGAGSAV